MAGTAVLLAIVESHISVIAGPDASAGCATSLLIAKLVLLSLQAAQAKQASAQDREALKVSRMEGEEMAAEMRRTQEWLTTLQTELLPAKQPCHVSATAGKSRLGLPAVGAFQTFSRDARGHMRRLSDEAQA